MGTRSGGTRSGGGGREAERKVGTQPHRARQQQPLQRPTVAAKRLLVVGALEGAAGAVLEAGGSRERLGHQRNGACGHQVADGAEEGVGGQVKVERLRVVDAHRG